MSSSDRRIFLSLVAALPLGACGFTPLYAPGGEAASLRGRVRPDDPTDALSFAFVAAFEDRAGRAGPAAPWALGYRISTDAVGTGLTPDNIATRIVLNGTLDWSVRPAAGEASGDVSGDVSGGDPVLSGREEAFTAYSATGSTVATRAARRDAEDRLMALLAERLALRLAVQAARLGP